MRHVIWITLFVGLSLLAGCGGGGGGGDAGPAYDLNGWWELGTRNSGSPAPYELALIMPTRQTGHVVVFNEIEFRLEGSTLRGASPDAASPDRTEYTFNVISNDHLEGVSVRYVGGVPDSSRDIRMLRYPAPSGTFTGVGNIGTTSVAFTSATAYALSQEDPSGPDYQIFVSDFQPDGTNALVLNFRTTAPLLNGVYLFGGTLDAGVIAANGESGSVTGGSVDITAASTNGVRGTYDLFLTSGRVTGAFDVEILIQE